MNYYEERTKTQRAERMGEINYNTRGRRMIIIEYVNSTNITIKFDNDYTVKCTYANFKIGEILNLYDTTLYNVGYLGMGVYKQSINNKFTLQFNTWRAMIGRCYDSNSHINPTYIDCTVCKDWHNFQVFAKWFDKNYYEIKKGDMRLDKDILHKGNKIYAPNNCVFTPHNINTLFTKRQNYRGDYPIGVTIDKRNGKFVSKCNMGKTGKVKYLGQYNTPLEAFDSYKQFKEIMIKKIADEYKDRIPKKLYDAMYKYIVEITD